MRPARRTRPELTAGSYRRLARPAGMAPFRIVDGETDLLLFGSRSLPGKAAQWVHEAREQITGYIRSHAGFRESLVPLPDDACAPDVVRTMLRAGIRARLGPMASVAGAIAEFTARRLLPHVPEIIAENGGDVFFRTDRPQRFGIVAESARNPLLHIEVGEAEAGAGMGVCTSSGTLGPSMNFGRADAVTIIARDTALADALATATSNRVRRRRDIGPALDWALEHGAEGAVIIAFDRVAAIGAVRFSG